MYCIRITTYYTGLSPVHPVHAGPFILSHSHLYFHFPFPFPFPFPSLSPFTRFTSLWLSCLLLLLLFKSQSVVDIPSCSTPNQTKPSSKAKPDRIVAILDVLACFIRFSTRYLYYHHRRNDLAQRQGKSFLLVFVPYSTNDHTTIRVKSSHLHTYESTCSESISEVQVFPSQTPKVMSGHFRSGQMIVL
jgi:hypothetical protein